MADQTLAVAAGDRLVVRRAIALPAVCMKCGAVDRAIVRRDRAFSFVTPWLYALLPLGPFGALGMLALTKTAALSVPLCERCDGRWRTASLLRTIVTAVAVATTLVSIFLPLLRPSAGLVASVGVTVVGFVAIVVAYALTASRVMRATSIDATHVTLAGADASASAMACRDATPGPELAARATIGVAVRLLVAHVLAYMLAFTWTVGAIARVILTLPTDLDPELATIAPLVLPRVGWEFVGVWIAVHVASLPWVFTRNEARAKWMRALFFTVVVAGFVAAIAVGAGAWSRVFGHG